MTRTTLSVSKERKTEFDALKRDGESADACLGRLIEDYESPYEGDEDADESVDVEPAPAPESEQTGDDDGHVVDESLRDAIRETLEEYGVATAGDVEDAKTEIPRRTADDIADQLRR